jgi:5-methylcytosine-specific restriction endonuclease McrA
MIYKKGLLTKAERRELIYRKYKGRCAYCGYKISLEKMTIDHIIPKHSFFNKITLGDVPFFMRNLTTEQLNHFDNLNPSCEVCNVLKSSLSFKEFIDKIKKMKYTSKNHRLKRRILKGKEFKFHFELHLPVNNISNCEV